MKIISIVARMVLGLLYGSASLAFFFNVMPQQQMTGAAEKFVMGLAASGYIMPVIKVIELLCAIAFISGRFVPLAAVVIFPITVNIALFHIMLVPESLLISIIMALANVMLFYTHRERYNTLLQLK